MANKVWLLRQLLKPVLGSKSRLFARGLANEYTCRLCHCRGQCQHGSNRVDDCRRNHKE
jgi:hypothetical protein